MLDAPILLLFRRDLRLSDNAALLRAVEEGRPVVPAFIFDDAPSRPWRSGGASRVWLHYSLAALRDDLAGLGVKLIIRRGDWAFEAARLAQECGAAAVHWSRAYEPQAEAEELELHERLQAAGTRARRFGGRLLVEPERIRSGSGTPYRVFSPFWRSLASAVPATPPLPRPEAITSFANRLESLAVEDLDLLPTRPDWSGGIRAQWRIGERAAQDALQDFIAGRIESYQQARDIPALPGTSRLSPHLHFGEISARQIWHAGQASGQSEAFLRELGWREFSYHLLYYFPFLPERPLRPEFQHFPWREDAAALRAWQQGRTGFPIVDAGLRELWQTGYMHNRVRMIAASFLIKDLLLPWQDGERWFWDTLVDADLANNSASWQWVAGCGADAAPFFRVFNPVLQGEKFDPKGDYVRRWIPELAGLPSKWIHRPWEAPELIDTAAKSYPKPIVDHGAARKRALMAFEQVKASASQSL